MVFLAMPILLSDLAKKLEIAPEAVMLHAIDLDFEIPEDEMITDEIANAIQKLEVTDELAQLDHEYEEQMDREILSSQQKKTAGSQKKVQKKKEDGERKDEEVVIVKDKEGAIILPENLTVRELAIKISKPIPIVLINLKKNGIVANLQQDIDYETAAIVAEELGIKVKKEQSELSGEDLFRGNLFEIEQVSINHPKIAIFLNLPTLQTMNPCIIIHYDEIAIKGKNRKFFEDQLIKNINEKIKIANQTQSVQRMYGRFKISFDTPFVWDDEKKEVWNEILSTTFGIANYGFGYETKNDEENLQIATKAIGENETFTTLEWGKPPEDLIIRCMKLECRLFL